VKKSYFKRKHKRSLAEIVIAALLFILCAVVIRGGILPDWEWLPLILYLAPYLVIGRRVLWKAARNILRGQVFDENFLMSLATVGALIVGEYPEAVFVMLFYRVGELFEELAVGKSRASIAALMEIRPDCAHVEREGETVTVDPAEVAVDEIISIHPGERVPLDGMVLEGITTLDTAALTGESLPREAESGDTVISGCVNLTGLIRVRVTKSYGESTVSKILELVENAGEHKSRSEQFITRFARYYTPVVVLAAVVLAVVPPLLVGMTDPTVWSEWIYRALSFLVISCPCALVISVPLSFFGGIGGASKRGILVKGSCYLEALAACDTVVFDKTGTLTEGRFSVTATHPAEGVTESELLYLAACAEQYSSHPIARALTAACPDLNEARNVEELAGHGVRATVTDREGQPHRVAVGNPKLMDSEGAAWISHNDAGTTVMVAADGVFMGSITVADTVKPDSAEAIAALRKCGVGRTVMLTGDSEAAASVVARDLGLDEYHAALLPADKVERVETLLIAPARKGKLAFVGDGINDAPVLARADIGIAMGGMGSDAAIEAADVVLMDDRMASLPRAISIARRTLRIVKQNIVFALGVKAVILVLGALGCAGLWAAVFADVGVAVIAILNAMRAMKTRD
jgi:Cd2+/Zn2+-exporting ATPase